MKKTFRTGAIGALMDEYERAALEYQSLIRKISPDDFSRVADAETADEDCRSIQTVTSHVLRAGYGYANYIRERFSLAADAAPREIVSHEEVEAKIAAMLDYTTRTLDGRWEMSDGEINKIVIKSRWGVTYDLEQLLEHAVVHVLRHRRQIEKFLLKFENSDAKRKDLVENYVRAYNTFDVEGMLANLHERVIFKNISGGETTHEIVGIEAFRQQAEQAAALFAEREQKIENMIFGADGCEIEIAYRAILAADLPNGLKAGDEIKLHGKSIFRFDGGKISEITDIS